MQSDMIFISVSVLKNIPYYDPDYDALRINMNEISEHLNYTSLQRINLIPVEITIIQYSLEVGVKYALHEFIKPGELGPIPIGFKSFAIKSADESHKILYGDEVPNTNTILQIASILDKMGSYSACNDIPVYVLSTEFDSVSQSLNYLAKMTGIKNPFPQILLFEDLIIDCLKACENEELEGILGESSIQKILGSVEYSYAVEFRYANILHFVIILLIVKCFV
ncbi:hypothetical protein HZS_6470 [Henneguya salminicola]|nr:hypothetical protein HZS_6470 [Henneguya salminicola]